MNLYALILRSVAIVAVAAGMTLALVGASVPDVAPAPIAKPDNVPTWTDVAAQHPDCEPAAAKVLYPRLVVVGLDGKSRVVSFDAAWAGNHDHNQANDVWVVGGCR